MRPLMIAGLALAVGLSTWTAFHDDGSEVQSVRQDPASKASKSAQPSSAMGKRASAATRTPRSAGAPANPQDVQALTEGVPLWQNRAALASSSLGAASPWASQRPPPPPPVAVAEAPPPPMAPPFPHTWAGRLDDKAVIAGPNTTWVVGQGGVIDGQWRVDQIQERQMTLTYLPLNQSQTVAMKSP